MMKKKKNTSLVNVRGRDKGISEFTNSKSKLKTQMDKNIIDDNVLKSVRIREQEWMVENLNVEHFRNGDIIPEAKTDEDWEKADDEKRPAWCYYDNDISNGEKYGKLYNWYAVSDWRGLAPEGWHVPTHGEWTELTDYLTANGHSGAEGVALKANSGWDDYGGQSGNGTDNYGWSGLPGSVRNYNGCFNRIGASGNWWSCSQDGMSCAWCRYLFHAHDVVGRDSFEKGEGYSVRCLRD